MGMGILDITAAAMDMDMDIRVMEAMVMAAMVCFFFSRCCSFCYCFPWLDFLFFPFFYLAGYPAYLSRADRRALRRASRVLI